MASKLQPALLAGVTLGVLSGLPFVSVGNLCCCLWIVAGGVLATYLLQQGQPLPVTYGDGALVGLFAGVVGFVVATAVSLLASLLPPPIGGAFPDQMAELMSEMPPEMREGIERVGFGAILAIGALISFMVTVVMATLGGLLGTALFQKKSPPGSVEPQPPPAPAPFG